MESCECCSRCCGKSIVQRSNDDLHKTCRFERITEKSKTPSSPRKYAPGCLKSRRIFEEAKQHEIASCADKFALAKRLHAENLQHQPLPDRVDDSIFKKGYHSCSDCERDAEYQDRNDVAVATLETEDHLFGPALGCKKPKTRMDLAICWETPMDPVYEPRRPTHIDGSEGGMAPAIFALIQHTPAPKNPELLIRNEGKSEHYSSARQQEAQKKNPKNHCCCDCSCNEPRDKLPRSRKSARSSSVPRITERKCAACQGGKSEAESERRKNREDPRLIRSAVGVAIGLEQRCRTMTGNDGARRNGLPPTRVTVPRPRTPFARRAFCIDTLAPPFSVVSGCRDADYPEHWRLMSVYQQSYRNPQKRKTRRF
ncbi:uncharacterized protein LOC126856599 isoform X2 [Cataglyphis hispanica]|uniref:uncharacterized protein LOC126856599 isoform X2 n=1 Tax=Cataglyphis hispanica TaxID=1086592 RepID=UPI002180194B|nr:uncharacterized protein LOC126856599 isoform X2 [Cataglyphis hispanica]